MLSDIEIQMCMMDLYFNWINFAKTMHKALLCVRFSFQSHSFYLIYLRNFREILGGGEAIGADNHWVYCAQILCQGITLWEFCICYLVWVSPQSHKVTVLTSLSSEATFPYTIQCIISWERTAKPLLCLLYHLSRIK